MSENERPKLFELERLAFFAPVEGNKRASLNFALREGYPRITVFTRTQSDNDGKGMLTAAFDLPHFDIFLSCLERVARNPADCTEKVSVKHFPRDASGKITGDREVSSEVWYGKKDGVVWISVVQPKRPKIVFELTLSDFHEFTNSKGESATKAEGSIMITLAVVRILRQQYTANATNFRDTAIPRVKSLPYSQRGKASGSGQTSTPASANFEDEDIMF